MRIVIVGGASRQWGPTLVTDIVRTPSLQQATIVLHDIDEPALERMARFATLAAATTGMVSVEATTDRAAALRGADFVVVTISTGGFDSMAHDLEVPARHGIEQSVGDTVGPGGISRSLRNVPVLVDIARDVEQLCPDAWLLNITNPMTVLTRAIARETNVRVVGLCHEVGHLRHDIATACGVRTRDVEVAISGVNHLPWVTSLSIAGDEGFDALRAAISTRPEGERFARENALKLDLLDRYGALAGAGDRHVAEFFPWVLTEASNWGKDWGVYLTRIVDRRNMEDWFRSRLDAWLDGRDELPAEPSGELVAPVIDSLVTGTRRDVPLNLPNQGQAPYLPADVVVETLCTVDRDGVRGRDAVVPPQPCAEWTRRHVAVQELTVEAAVSGDRELVRAAMALDPLCSRLDLASIDAMTGDLLAATAEWLPQFA